MKNKLQICQMEDFRLSVSVKLDDVSNIILTHMYIHIYKYKFFLINDTGVVSNYYPMSYRCFSILDGEFPKQLLQVLFSLFFLIFKNP